jgi:hypothetical protein
LQVLALKNQRLGYAHEAGLAGEHAQPQLVVHGGGRRSENPRSSSMRGRRIGTQLIGQGDCRRRWRIASPVSNSVDVGLGVARGKGPVAVSETRG